MKIDVVVHGRFYAFDLCRGLVERGHDVRLLTNYPRYIVERFGVRGVEIRCNPLHGVALRLLTMVNSWLRLNLLHRMIHETFSRWAKNRVRLDAHAVVCFSGVAEELFATLGGHRLPLKVLIRGSSHVRSQRDLLVAEQARIGGAVERPSDWMVAREEREYQLADKIVVLSSFAYQSFVRNGVDSAKLALHPLGVELSRFLVSSHVHAVRKVRILSRSRLRVLMVGSLSARKGALDFLEVAEILSREFEFRFVGDVAADLPPAITARLGVVELVGRVSEFELSEHYAWGDVFLFPTIEDGYAAVIAQANAAGLPVICTTNCGGSDIVESGKTGWVLPIRRPDLIVERLLWCHCNRVELAEVTETVATTVGASRTWNDVAADLESLVSQND